MRFGFVCNCPWGIDVCVGQSEASVVIEPDRRTKTRRLLKLAAVGAVLSVVIATGLFIQRGDRAIAQSDIAVDLAIVLAIDCSYSVDRGEYELQVTGLSQAFRHPEVLAAIQNGPHGRIAVSVVQWSDLSHQAVVIPWRIVSDTASAGQLANLIAVAPRSLAEGGTSITAVMGFAANMLRSIPFKADRLVIDVAADGRNNNGGDPRPMRDAVIAEGITINGLAILNEVPTLDRYFELYVTGGPANFVEVANDYRAYALAIYRKLLREIIGPQVS